MGKKKNNLPGIIDTEMAAKLLGVETSNLNSHYGTSAFNIEPIGRYRGKLMWYENAVLKCQADRAENARCAGRYRKKTSAKKAKPEDRIDRLERKLDDLLRKFDA